MQAKNEAWKNKQDIDITNNSYMPQTSLYIKSKYVTVHSLPLQHSNQIILINVLRALCTTLLNVRW